VKGRSLLFEEEEDEEEVLAFCKFSSKEIDLSPSLEETDEEEEGRVSTFFFFPK
jgi:hypothetical protein